MQTNNKINTTNKRTLTKQIISNEVVPTLLQEQQKDEVNIGLGWSVGRCEKHIFS